MIKVASKHKIGSFRRNLANCASIRREVAKIASFFAVLLIDQSLRGHHEMC